MKRIFWIVFIVSGFGCNPNSENQDTSQNISQDKVQQFISTTPLQPTTLSQQQDKKTLEELIEAIDDEDVELVQQLAPQVDLNAHDASGVTPLYSAIDSMGVLDLFSDKDRLLKIMEILLKNGADPNVQTQNKKIPFEGIIFVHSNYEEKLIRLLLKYGANPNIKNEYGNAPLHYTYYTRNEIKNLEILLENGADPNLKNKAGETPLHTFIYAGNKPEYARVLLEHGADPRIKNKYNELPIDRAKDLFGRKTEVFKVIQKYTTPTHKDTKS